MTLFHLPALWSGYRSTLSSAERAFGGVVVLALLWSGVPLVIAAMLTSSRGESIGMAIVLTRFLGWIGLAIVYFGQRKSHDAVEGLMDRLTESAHYRTRVVPRLSGHAH